MRGRILPLALLLLCLPATSLACRCEQLPLARYFQQAEFVAMAKLTAATDEPGRRSFEFELMAAPYKGGSDTQKKGSVVRLATALSTAACGIQPDLNAIYVLFGKAVDSGSDALWVNSCDGTRVHISTQLDEPVGFVDVPARFVAGQLNAHFGLEVLRDVSANAPRPNDPHNDKLIGLLDLNALAHGGHVTVFSEPSPSASVIKEVRSYDDVVSRDYAYEQPGAVIYATLPDWYRVRVTDGPFGWLSAEGAGTWFPYEDLPIRRLAYLGDEWSGLIWPGPGAGIPVRKELPATDRPREIPVNVLESAEIGGMPWFRIEVLASDPCSGDDPKPGHAGWLPGYGRNGQPTVWFYSRGC